MSNREDESRCGLPQRSERSPVSGVDASVSLWVVTSRGALRLELQAIEAVEAADDYVLLHMEGRSHLHRSRLSELEKRLPAVDWVRIHRSALVRLGAVVRLDGPARRARVTTGSGRVLPVSRVHVITLRARLGLARPSAKMAKA